ncbi:MAG: cytochrome oxidase subunit III [Candidatus Tectomicrobia bacterium]|uniref:Cytochrome oxidase subunit III n=1 Tax=Tectimicrobiota bacterium TaxID=2528274 RepID=A0A938B2M4_UNCTE|nr:cytochrome oxidase subunit III [Candidatus Tectomicrobia bacterium]
MASPVPSGKLGMWWFLSSEIVTFGGLISCYLVARLLHPSWADSSQQLNVLVATLNTIVLLVSSWTIVMAHDAVEHGDVQQAKPWLGYTILGGLLFLLIKSAEWSGKFEHGILPWSNGFWSFYFAMTGLHALHVLGGVVINVALWIAAVRGRLQPIAHRVEYAGLYWHFVDVVWIFLFPLLYLA